MNNAMENPVIQAIKRLSLGSSRPTQDYTSSPTPAGGNYTTNPTPAGPGPGYTSSPTPDDGGFMEILRKLFGAIGQPGGGQPAPGPAGHPWQPQQAYTSQPTPAAPGATSLPTQDYTHQPTQPAPLLPGWAPGSGGGTGHNPVQPFDGIVRQPLGPVSQTLDGGSVGGGPLTGDPVPGSIGKPWQPMSGSNR